MPKRRPSAPTSLISAHCAIRALDETRDRLLAARPATEARRAAAAKKVLKPRGAVPRARAAVVRPRTRPR